MHQQYNFKDWVSGRMTKAVLKQEAGLDLERRDEDGQIYVTKVYSIAKMFTEVQVGDRVLKIQGRDVTEYDSIEDIYQVFRDNMKISFETLHQNSNSPTGPELIDIDVEIGDVVKLTEYLPSPELNDTDVKVLRELKGRKWMVQSLKTKEKFLVQQHNLNYEICHDQIMNKQPTN